QHSVIFSFGGRAILVVFALLCSLTVTQKTQGKFHYHAIISLCPAIRSTLNERYIAWDYNSRGNSLITHKTTRMLIKQSPGCAGLLLSLYCFSSLSALLSGY